MVHAPILKTLPCDLWLYVYMEKAIQVIIVSLPPEIQGLAADNTFKEYII